MSSSKIQATIIIEVIGRPPEHLTETLEELIKQIDSEKEVKVLNKKLNEPTLIKDQKDLYVSFAEVELECDEMAQLFLLSLKYMPANIEISSPSSINISNDRLNQMINELLMKLHQYDEVARILQTEKTILEKKLKGLLGKKADSENLEEED